MATLSKLPDALKIRKNNPQTRSRSRLDTRNQLSNSSKSRPFKMRQNEKLNKIILVLNAGLAE